MTDRFSAIVAVEIDGRSSGSLRELTLADLPDEDVLIRVSHSTLNYKDALAITGAGKICRKFPMVCGIDLAGTVVESRDPQFRAGQPLLVNGFGLGERHWGGLAQYARVNRAWPFAIPSAFSSEQAMAIGTAGYTAMLCVQALEDHGVKPGSGPVLVTGASGGVGSVSVMLLAKLGYDVVAATGRAAANREFLTRLGARDLIDRAELARAPKPLESERWAGAIDSVGGDTLATILAQTRYGGTVAATGLAGGATLNITVMPFILRGVTLAGVDSVMRPREPRERAWHRLAGLIDKSLLATLYEVQPLSKVPALAADLLAGKLRGRVVIDVNA
ncbi:MAG: oxidoreductase [Gammaproteobacteria bacterium]|nr:oxidoreductase [Gammaproteobacteria bacterium]